MKNICIFCGSSPGKGKTYKKEAKAFGKLLAKNNYRLVYGGGSTGLMGAVADGVIDAGGKVLGVIPEFLIKKEIGHNKIHEMIVTDTMHERKQKMADISDAFIALPGGMGTMDELCEIVTWSQLGLHKKPIGIYNINGFFDLQLMMFDKMVEERFVSEAHRKIMINDYDPVRLLDKLKNYKSPVTEKWLDREKV
ncbi:TIGR00730 family Rossman fold protein [Flammeovirgaceae bacterium SG7u.111]|nr:TIGR00730 family Rossman fold protein [Flammeovirgaceae bacterium SG7u.132]WPO33164.1 TIGR00730 family Rossman fold protein [Flammeovirgaceae bacterium SG7u.111]